MIKKFIFFLILCLLFCSCGSHVVVSSEGCKTNARWFSNQSAREAINFEIIETLKTPLGFFKKEHIRLADILSKHNVKCSDLDAIYIKTKHTVSDALFSFIPFASRKTIILTGRLSDFTIKDDVIDTKEGR